MNKLKDYQNNYNPYYNLYLNNLSKSDELLECLIKNHEKIYTFFDSIDQEKYNYTYSSEKWDIAQIFQHIIDTERIFCYRALKIAREPLPLISDYDHEEYAKNTIFQSKSTLLEDYTNNRKSSISLFKTFKQSDFKKSANFNHYTFSLGLIPFIFCGHELHHINIIASKYLNIQDTKHHI